MSLTFEDWFSDVEDLPFKITVLHSSQDKLVKIDFTRTFSSSFPDKMEFIEIEVSGFAMILRQTDKSSLLRKVIENYQN